MRARTSLARPVDRPDPGGPDHAQVPEVKVGIDDLAIIKRRQVRPRGASIVGAARATAPAVREEVAAGIGFRSWFWPREGSFSTDPDGRSPPPPRPTVEPAPARRRTARPRGRPRWHKPGRRRRNHRRRARMAGRVDRQGIGPVVEAVEGPDQSGRLQVVLADLAVGRGAEDLASGDGQVEHIVAEATRSVRVEISFLNRSSCWAAVPSSAAMTFGSQTWSFLSAPAETALLDSGSKADGEDRLAVADVGRVWSLPVRASKTLTSLSLDEPATLTPSRSKATPSPSRRTA